MRAVAARSARVRAWSFAAFFVSVFLGRVITGAFSVLAAAGAGEVSAADADRLTLLGAVVGSWAAVIVLFSVASTLTLILGQRQGEVALLRAVGATGWQVRRLLLAESMLVTVVAVVLASVPAAIVGELLLAAMRSTGMIEESVQATGKVLALAASGFGIGLVSLIAGVLATHRVTRESVRAAGRNLHGRSVPTGRIRTVGGILLVLGGLGGLLVTATVPPDDPDPLASMSTAGPSGVLTVAGLAALSPVLLRLAAGRCAAALHHFGGAGYLAAEHLRSRTQVLGAVLAPIIVLTGISSGTAYLIAIQNAAGAHTPNSAEVEDAQLLNQVVVAMIGLFAAIMVVNTLAATVADRRREFELHRLAGATARQIRRILLLEAGFLAGVGVLVGTLGALAMACSFSWVEQDRLLPEQGPWYFLAAAAFAVTLTLTTTATLTGRAVASAVGGGRSDRPG